MILAQTGFVNLDFQRRRSLRLCSNVTSGGKMSDSKVRTEKLSVRGIIEISNCRPKLWLNTRGVKKGCSKHAVNTI